MNPHVFRLPDDVLAETQQVAREEGMSVDTLIDAFISDALRQRRERGGLRQRASRGTPEAALAILNSLPSLPTDEWDEMPGEQSGSSRGADRIS